MEDFMRKFQRTKDQEEEHIAGERTRTEGHSLLAPYTKLEDGDTNEEENWGGHCLNTG
jgi:hypothetical protein